MKYWSQTGGGISIPPANASAPVYSAPVNTVSPPANISMPVFTSPPSTGTAATVSASIPVIYILIGVIALVAIIVLVVMI